MYTKIKNEQEIADMRRSCSALHEIKKILKDAAVPGITTMDLENLFNKEAKKRDVKPAFKGVYDYPYSILTSVNEGVVHSPPSDYVLKKGDVLSIDSGVKYKNQNSDSAFTVCVGEEPTGDKKRLIEGTHRAMMAAIDTVKDGVKVGTIGAAAQGVMESQSLGIIKSLVGHGIGENVHEDPQIPNYGVAGTGETLKAGMTVCIEPMATLGDGVVVLDESDGWTYASKDGSLGAHWEETVLVTEDGYEILT